MFVVCSLLGFLFYGVLGLEAWPKIPGGGQTRSVQLDDKVGGYFCLLSPITFKDSINFKPSRAYSSLWLGTMSTSATLLQ
jgi:hypothetical protein